MSSHHTIYFTTRIGPEKKRLPFPVDPSLCFSDVVGELCKKLDLHQESLSFAIPSGIVMTISDMNKRVGEVVVEFGNSFEVINQGDVGGLPVRSG